MIPNFIKKTGLATAVISGVVFCYWTLADWHAGVVFGLSSAWMLSNLFVWSALCTSVFRPQGADKGKTALFLFLKFALILGGFAAIIAAAPLTRGQALALVAGITSVLAVLTLTVLGSLMMGIDIFDSSKKNVPDKPVTAERQ